MHEKFMRRCIDLARNGLGTTYPNPLVGSVIVFDDKIIGEGWHKQSGGPHAEVNAINSLQDKSLLRAATLYVNLEPCSHHGKTPPCSDMIIGLGIPRVVIGCTDPNPEVAGNGIRKLSEAGIEVTQGVLEKDAVELNRRFFTSHLKKRPFVILKWAESSDGFIAPKEKRQTSPHWISNAYSRQLVHKWRSEEAAILVGAQTVMDDNPGLGVRDWTGRNPVRIVIARRSLPVGATVLDGKTKTIVITEKKFPATGENIIFEIADFSLPVAGQTLEILHRHGLQSVIVEGGRHTLQAFIDAGLWDEARVFIGTGAIGKGIPAPVLHAVPLQVAMVAGDQLKIFRNHDQHDYL